MAFSFRRFALTSSAVLLACCSADTIRPEDVSDRKDWLSALFGAGRGCETRCLVLSVRENYSATENLSPGCLRWERYAKRHEKNLFEGDELVAAWTCIRLFGLPLYDSGSWVQGYELCRSMHTASKLVFNLDVVAGNGSAPDAEALRASLARVRPQLREGSFTAWELRFILDSRTATASAVQAAESALDEVRRARDPNLFDSSILEQDPQSVLARIHALTALSLWDRTEFYFAGQPLDKDWVYSNAQ